MAEQSTANKTGDLEEAEIHAIRDADLVETRRNQILDASLKLFLEKGYAATTVRDICAASGVNQASLYDYIANKQDILRRLLNRLWFNRDIDGLADRLGEAGNDAPLAPILVDYYRERFFNIGAAVTYSMGLDIKHDLSWGWSFLYRDPLIPGADSHPLSAYDAELRGMLEAAGYVTGPEDEARPGDAP